MLIIYGNCVINLGLALLIDCDLLKENTNINWLSENCQEFDDELSDLYLQKSMDKFRVKWKSKFSKKSLSADYVDGCHKDEEIANTFSKHFSSYQFNSYINSTQFDDCLKSV